MNELNRQLISMYAKQLRVPTFNQYEEVIRQLDGDKGFLQDTTPPLGIPSLVIQITLFLYHTTVYNGCQYKNTRKTTAFPMKKAAFPSKTKQIMP